MSTIDSGHCEARYGSAEGQQEAVLVGRGEGFDLRANVRARCFSRASCAASMRQRRLVNSELGMATIMWSIDTLDYTGSSSATITNRVLRRAHNGAIILGHDIQARTIQAVPALIDGLKSRSFKFVTVSQLIR